MFVSRSCFGLSRLQQVKLGNNENLLLMINITTRIFLLYNMVIVTIILVSNYNNINISKLRVGCSCLVE